MNLAVKLLALLHVGIIIIDKHNGEELNLNFQQNDYQLTFERMEVVRYNKRIVEECKIVTFKYNRTTPVLNGTFTLKVDVGDELVGIIQVYKFLSNEYRYFPTRFAANGCKAYTANMVGLKTGLETCGNVIGCPFRKGIKYEICNWCPDPSKFPPLIPNGQYKAEVQLLRSTEELGVVNAYVTVSRPFVSKNMDFT